jgi:hypothetical protein
MWPASVNVLTKAVAGPAARPQLTEAGHHPNRLRGAFEKVTVNLFCSSVHQRKTSQLHNIREQITTWL